MRQMVTAGVFPRSRLLGWIAGTRDSRGPALALVVPAVVWFAIASTTVVKGMILAALFGVRYGRG